MQDGQRRRLQNMITNYRLKGWDAESIVRIVRVAARGFNNPHPIPEEDIVKLLIDNGLPPRVPDLYI